ncbi:MAG: hypothetical protein RL141_139 [Candidatus Parcubacteria bacterium]|jgi:histidine triad (HIT) family protein
MPTLFTKIINGEIPCHKIWEDEQHFAFLDIHPAQPGMTLVVPKQEVEHPFDMDDAAFSALLLAAKHLVPAIQKATGALRVGLVIEGLEVPHAHIKLIPINAPHDLSAQGTQATGEALQAMAEKIRAHL